MAMVYSCLFFPNSTPLSPGKPTTTTNSNTQLLHLTSTNLPGSIKCNNTTNKQTFSSLEVASISTPILPSINMEYLKREFSGQDGVSFEDMNDDTSSVVVKMALDDGSVASLMLPSGLITSYKAPMWHGGTLELLHTCVSPHNTNSQQQQQQIEEDDEEEEEEEEEEEDDDNIFIRGGVSLAFTCQSEGISWSPTTWTLHTIKGDPQQLIQVELVTCSNAVDMIQVKHIVTLQQGLLSSEIVITNLKSLPISVMGCLISHLNVSTPEATYVVGLEGSDFYTRPPISSNFSIIPPQEDLNSKEFWGPISQFFSISGGRRQEEEVTEEAEGEERDNYKHLTDRMSRVYTSAPRCFTLIDRGRRNSVEVERDGFNEMYINSPGSTHKWYGKYAYICIGQSALLQPIILAPRTEWRGSQLLRNPNS